MNRHFTVNYGGVKSGNYSVQVQNTDTLKFWNPGNTPSWGETPGEGWKMKSLAVTHQGKVWYDTFYSTKFPVDSWDDATPALIYVHQGTGIIPIDYTTIDLWKDSAPSQRVSIGTINYRR